MNADNLGSRPRKILIIRTDRLGDVILSLPVLTALKATFPAVVTGMLVRRYTAEIVADYPDLNELLIFDEYQPASGFKLIKFWAKKLRQHQFDTVLLLHPTFQLALICYLAGIPQRVGTGFRAYSFLFNQKVFHHRKNATKHELEFNLELAKKIGATIDQVVFKIYIPEKAHQIAREFIHQLALAPGQKLVILHPGSGGSARDWPLRKFAELNDRLQQELDVKTIVTGGPDEKALLDQFLVMSATKAICWLGSPQADLKALAALIPHADLFISNSTGPLHLAVAVGTPVIGFYCPIIPCLPQRWGPYGHLDSVLMPPVAPCKKCTTHQCQYFDCMNLIEVKQALELTRKKLNL